ncbi:MAG TPA: hypothetical protein VN783_00860 [Thermoanaerobaculia bacterium]|nr:hypothetical protein [Thermoanaerobaculia bacterium]
MNDSSSLAGRLRHWELLVNTSLPLLDELPQVREAHAQLTELIGGIKGHADHEQSLRGQITKSVAERSALEEAARAARAKLATSLRGHFGPQNEQLLEFGIPVSRAGRRAKAAAAQAAMPQPPSQPSPESASSK